jgi:hypothetical protein
MCLINFNELYPMGLSLKKMFTVNSKFNWYKIVSKITPNNSTSITIEK